MAREGRHERSLCRSLAVVSMPTGQMTARVEPRRPAEPYRSRSHQAQDAERQNRKTWPRQHPHHGAAKSEHHTGDREQPHDCAAGEGSAHQATPGKVALQPTGRPVAASKNVRIPNPRSHPSRDGFRASSEVGCRTPAGVRHRDLLRVLPSTPILPPSALPRIADFRQSSPGRACRSPAKKVSTGQPNQGADPRLGHDRRLVRAGSARQDLGSRAKRHQRLTVARRGSPCGRRPTGDRPAHAAEAGAYVRSRQRPQGKARLRTQDSGRRGRNPQRRAPLPQPGHRGAGATDGDLQRPRLVARDRRLHTAHPTGIGHPHKGLRPAFRRPRPRRRGTGKRFAHRTRVG